MKKQEQELFHIRRADLEYLYLEIRRLELRLMGTISYFRFEKQDKSEPAKICYQFFETILLLWNHPAFAAIEKG